MSILRLLAEQMTVPDGQGERTPPYRMFIRDLVLLCRIGVYAHEKLRPQRVRINVSMRVEAEAEPRNDDIANVLSYDEVLGGIKRLAAGEHINLVETLAEAIADLCLVHRRVIEVRVMIEKLDVEPGASVGVEIERRRGEAS
ncbi:MAG TPA: dihydroneopterin aldolase [Dongiaceae bacterium]|jgi:7,8-dihydroneopterin aldolase/epimerase/oxygenase